MRRTFGPKSDEVTVKCRKLHNEELNDLYSLPNILRVIKLRRMGWTVHVACMGRAEVVYTGFWYGNLRERVRWKTRSRWEDNIKMDLQEVGGRGMDWMDLAQERDRGRALVKALMKLQFP